MFIDEATIFTEGGRGGDGCASFHREKYRPRGGPDGGTGGPGGDVVLVASTGRATLSEFNRKRHYKAGRGGRAGPNNRKGAAGDELVVPVPPGTVVMDEDGMVIADLVEPGQRFVAAVGGRGGSGNASLKAEAGPLPRFAEKGEAGRSAKLRLELKLVADVAIVGFPNAGKSSLISRVSGARPKVAQYPFTTTEPNLGTVEGEDIDYVLTDVPGLIEGAHLGKGMGVGFLRHIERASIIVFLVDMSPVSGRRPVDDLVVLESELREFSAQLEERRRVVAANKMDLSPAPEVMEVVREECRRRGLEVFPLSVATGEGLGALMEALEEMVKEVRESPTAGAEVVYAVPVDEDMMNVEREHGRFVVRGRRVERLVNMTDWDNDDALAYLAGKLRGAGVEDAVARAGAMPGDEVEIAGRVFEFIPDEGGGGAGPQGLLA
ncbi:MAG: GTPase ObgE [Actinomycetia bacterium]|nr:GTPase ObgE [Actinomycetes bacterium]